jgi:hypothetical protein
MAVAQRAKRVLGVPLVHRFNVCGEQRVQIGLRVQREYMRCSACSLRSGTAAEGATGVHCAQLVQRVHGARLCSGTARAAGALIASCSGHGVCAVEFSVGGTICCAQRAQWSPCVRPLDCPWQSHGRWCPVPLPRRAALDGAPRRRWSARACVPVRFSPPDATALRCGDSPLPSSPPPPPGRATVTPVV